MENKIIESKEKIFKRNSISFYIEGALYSFTTTVFSVNSVLPAFISLLSDDPKYISMLSVFYSVPMYFIPVFACLLASKKHPKRRGLTFCSTQRIGQIMMFITSLYIGLWTNEKVVIVFLIGYLTYIICNGLGSSTYSDMVNASLYRNVGSVMGNYYFIGNISGIFSSLLLTYLSAKYIFPYNYQVLFGVAVLCSILSIITLIIGLKRYPDEKIPEEDHLKAKDMFPLFKKILKENKSFRQYTICSIILGVAEISFPFFIVRYGSAAGLPVNYTEIIIVIGILSQAIASLLGGKICDNLGVIEIQRIVCVFGFAGTLFGLINTNFTICIISYICVCMAFGLHNIAGQTMAMLYSKGTNETPTVYISLSKLCALPFVLLAAVLNSVITNYLPITYVLGFALVCYIITLAIIEILKRKNNVQGKV